MPQLENTSPGSHRVDVIRVEVIEPHPNADRLGVIKPFGYQVCAALGEFRPGDLAAYVPPDSMVDTRRPEFAFLRRGASGSGFETAVEKKPPRDFERIKVKKLRGLYSQGLLIKAPSDAQVGDDVAEQLGVTHYEPPSIGTASDAECGPEGLHAPVFGVESYRRYPHVLRPDETLVVSEKLHGSNMRATHHAGRFWVGSHRQWKKEGDNAFWRAFRACPPLHELLVARSDLIAYGEVYGWVQDLRYGLPPNGVRVAVFDLWSKVRGAFLGWNDCVDIRATFDIPWVPVITTMPFAALACDEDRDRAELIAHAEGPSLVVGADHVREGCVIRPVGERWNEEIGRVILKVVSNTYLERA